MSTLQNTLNAYAAKLKAQRRAAEREAQALARAKSVEQKLADKMRIQTQRLQRQELSKVGAQDLVDYTLDAVIREIKTDYNEFLRPGERASITRDLYKIAELYYYRGTVPGRVAHKVIDASQYSKPAFMSILGVLLNLQIVEEKGAVGVVESNLRTLVCFRSNTQAAVTFLDTNTFCIETAKNKFVEHCLQNLTGVFYDYQN